MSVIHKRNGKESCLCGHHGGIWGSGGTDPLIPNLGSRWTDVVSFTPWLLYSTTYETGGWPPIWPGRFGK
jgi:hypothetical protein